MIEQLMDNISNEEHERLISISEHAISPPLSPAAQAVLDAFTDEWPWQTMPDPSESIAAALRAAADHVEWPADVSLRIIASELEATT
jgi:hypothetical protein